MINNHQQYYHQVCNFLDMYNDYLILMGVSLPLMPLSPCSDDFTRHHIKIPAILFCDWHRQSSSFPKIIEN